MFVDTTAGIFAVDLDMAVPPVGSTGTDGAWAFSPAVEVQVGVDSAPDLLAAGLGCGGRFTAEVVLDGLIFPLPPAARVVFVAGVPGMSLEASVVFPGISFKLWPLADVFMGTGLFPGMVRPPVSVVAVLLD